MVRSLINQNCAKSSQHLHQSNIAEDCLVFISSIPILEKLGEQNIQRKEILWPQRVKLVGGQLKHAECLKMQ